MAPTPSDLFLSHDWGVNQSNHKKVSVINDALEGRGFKTWFDVDEMHGDIDLAMTDGIENTKVVLSFITENYRDKVNGDNAIDNCRKEFQHSINCRKVPLCVVLEPSMRNPSEWMGKLGINCASRLYVDMCGDVNNAAYLSAQMDQLCTELSVLGVKGGEPKNAPAAKPTDSEPKNVPAAKPADSGELADGEYKLVNVAWGGPLCSSGAEDPRGGRLSVVRPKEILHIQIPAGIERIKLQKQEDGSYKVFNSRLGRPLYCEDPKEVNGDRAALFQTFLNFGDEYGEEGKERWKIVKQGDGYYKMYNQKWGGPLYSEDPANECGEHKTYVNKRRNYEEKGKERWQFEFVSSDNLNSDQVEDGIYKLLNVYWSGPLYNPDNDGSPGNYPAFVRDQYNWESGGKQVMGFEKQKDGTYKIENFARAGPLYAENAPDKNGDHETLFKNSSEYDEYKEKGRDKWIVNKQADGYYKLFNFRLGGPLYAEDDVENDGDHRTFVKSFHSYEEDGKERWELERLYGCSGTL